MLTLKPAYPFDLLLKKYKFLIILWQLSFLLIPYLSFAEPKNLSLDYIVNEKAYFTLLEKDVLSYIEQKKLKSPTCFISYAWGNPDHEAWVKRLAEMLVKAQFVVLLDRWEDRKGRVLTNFIKKIEGSDWIIVVGTNKYLEKYNKRANSLKEREHVVKIEAQLLEYLISFNEKNGDRVVPILLEGTGEESLPFMFRHKIASDFTKNNYFEELLRLIHDLYKIDNQDNTFESFVKKLRKYSSAISMNITEKDRQEFEKTRRQEIEKLDNKIFDDVDKIKKEVLLSPLSRFRARYVDS